MVSATFAAFAALCVASTAIDLFPFLELLSRSGTSTSTQAASAPDGAVQVFILLSLLAATSALFTAVASIYLHHAAAAAAVGGAAGNKRLISELVPFVVLCGAAGVLEFLFFVQPYLGGASDDDVGGGALGRAAVDALPAAATVAFFLGITLVIAHIRAGGEGGGGGGPDDHRGRGPVSVDVLKKLALGAAAAVAVLIGQVAAALYVK